MNTETKASYDAMGATQRNAAHDFNSSKEKLAADLRILKADAETMIRQAVDSSAEGFAALRSRLEGKLADAKAQLGRTRAAVDEKARNATGAAQTYIKEKPFHVAGAVAAAGALLGSYLASGRAGLMSPLDGAEAPADVPAIANKFPVLALAVTGCAVAASAYFIRDYACRMEKKQQIKKDLSVWEDDGGSLAPEAVRPFQAR